MGYRVWSKESRSGTGHVLINELAKKARITEFAIGGTGVSMTLAGAVSKNPFLFFGGLGLVALGRGVRKQYERDIVNTQRHWQGQPPLEPDTPI